MIRRESFYLNETMCDVFLEKEKYMLMKRQRSETDTIEFHILSTPPNGKGTQTLRTASSAEKRKRQVNSTHFSQ